MSNFKKLDCVSDNDVISYSESAFKIKKIRTLITESISASFGSILEALMKKMLSQDKHFGETLIQQITRSSEIDPFKINNFPFINAEILQVNGEWKPCKIRMRLELEVYTEEETDVNVDSSVDQADSVSLLDDIRQSIATNLQ